jgi:hypothetical protein
MANPGVWSLQCSQMISWERFDSTNDVAGTRLKLDVGHILPCNDPSRNSYLIRAK